jgi:hypothetical protein
MYMPLAQLSLIMAALRGTVLHNNCKSGVAQMHDVCV